MGHGARLRLCALAFAGCAIAGCTLAGCSGAAPHQARHLPVSQPPARPSAHSSPSGPVGSPGNPLMLSCTGQSVGPAGALPAPDDLVTGPLDILSGKKLATADPAGYGDRGEYKVPVAIGPGATVTVMIAPQARGRVVIDNSYGPAGGVAAATYHSCPAGWTVFIQGFAFPDHRARGCVPLDVQADSQPRTLHLTVSLFAGTCAR